MKRTPLNRGNKELKKSPLKSNSTLKRTNAGLSSTSSLKRTEFNASSKTPLKAKSKEKSTQEIECRKIVSARSKGTCEICGIRTATDMAHRVAASQSGKWVPSNILHACRFCHSYNHDNPQNSFDHGWHLRMETDSLKAPVLLAVNGVKSWFLLDNKGAKKPHHSPEIDDIF